MTCLHTDQIHFLSCHLLFFSLCPHIEVQLPLGASVSESLWVVKGHCSSPAWGTHQPRGLRQLRLWFLSSEKWVHLDSEF